VCVLCVHYTYMDRLASLFDQHRCNYTYMDRDVRLASSFYTYMDRDVRLASSFDEDASTGVCMFVCV
jgi:hypothetical protein